MTDGKKPPPFFCPSCNQKHRANIDELLGNPQAVMRATCTRCGLSLTITLNEDGSLACADASDESSADAPAADDPGAPKAAPAPVRSSRRNNAKGDTRKKDNKKKSDKKDKKKDSGGAKAESKDAMADAEWGEGDHIDRYAIERVIGEGGTSFVYQAFDPTTNRSVALKVLRKGLSEQMTERFLREIEVQANIRHQNIMPVFDRGELPDGRPYFTMELLYNPIALDQIVEHRAAGTLGRVEGLKDLQELPELIRNVLIPVADGIYVANVENGVIHRDLKPSNVLVDTRTMRPYVIDFGICHVLERRGATRNAVIPPTTDDAGIVGTPRFLAPEQVKGTVHARTDVWGLGALLRYVLTNESPIEGASSITRADLKRRIEALRKTREAAEASGDERKVDLCDEKLARLEDPNLRVADDIFRDARDANYNDLPAATPPALTAVIEKAMAKSPSDRYVNVRQVVRDLQSWLAGSSVRALREVGGKAAAVASARRAVKRHTTAAAFGLGGLALGLALGFGLAGKQEAPASSRLADAGQDIEALGKRLDPMRGALEAGELSILEQRLIFDDLHARADQIEARLRDEPNEARVVAARERLAFIRNRFAPALVELEVPEEVELSASSRLAGHPGKVELVRGENRLPPGAYDLLIEPGEVRLALDVPLIVRDAQQRAQPDREAAWRAVRLPVDPASIAGDYALVLGGRVRARRPPVQRTVTTAKRPSLPARARRGDRQRVRRVPQRTGGDGARGAPAHGGHHVGCGGKRRHCRWRSSPPRGGRSPRGCTCLCRVVDRTHRHHPPPPDRSGMGPRRRWRTGLCPARWPARRPR